eukprot:TRINITY_DN3016_c0_g1_i4.p1 TRINITY_DN3016_c0_g1~~TRINITY_DN3016_c0_g1_i4.p1  ORF type:complete len:177 (+),score=7.37 TRINITY_DN3016_c0_g1_i4:263-793(+)
MVRSKAGLPAICCTILFAYNNSRCTKPHRTHLEPSGSMQPLINKGLISKHAVACLATCKMREADRSSVPQFLAMHADTRAPHNPEHELGLIERAADNAQALWLSGGSRKRKHEDVGQGGDGRGGKKKWKKGDGPGSSNMMAKSQRILPINSRRSLMDGLAPAERIPHNKWILPSVI